MFKEIIYKGEGYIEDPLTKNKIKRNFQFINPETDSFETITKEEIIKELIRQRLTKNINCINCFDIENCEDCIESRSLSNCYKCEMSVALINCKNCKICMGLENKSNLEDECSFWN